MPITEEHMEQGEWTVSLLPDTPKHVHDAVDVRTYAFASIVVTPVWIQPGALSDASILAAARYTGVYPDHGYTLRGVVGHIPGAQHTTPYFWKGGKWLRALGAHLQG